MSQVLKRIGAWLAKNQIRVLEESQKDLNNQIRLKQCEVEKLQRRIKRYERGKE